MKRYVPIDGFHFEKTPYDQFVETLFDADWITEDLGPCSDGVNHFYGISIGDPSKPTIFIDTIHGLHEWRSFHWTRGFAEELVRPRKAIHEKIMSELLRHFHFYIMPCQNPYGYIHNKRGNYNNVDLNRNFDYMHDKWQVPPEDIKDWGDKGPYPFSEIESQKMKEKFLEFKPVMYLNTHTWGAPEGSVDHVASQDTMHYYWLGRDVVDSVQLTDRDNIYHWADPYYDMPVSANWAALQKSDRGFHPFVSVPEAGGSMSEYHQAQSGMNMLFAHSLHMLDYMKNKNLIIY